MEIKIFSDVIDALEKVGKALVTLKNIPKQKRKNYIDAVSSSFTLLDSALMLVINRLNDIALIKNGKDLAPELLRLNNSKEWMTLEKDMRLCSNLRMAYGEVDSFVLSFMANLTGSDWNNVRCLVDQVLEREGQLADFLASSLSHLAKLPATQSSKTATLKKTYAEINATIEAVKAERRRLIVSELTFLKAATGT
jgi:hypothetical protein